MSDGPIQTGGYLFLGEKAPEYHDRESGERVTMLGPLGRINLFVGATNAGKSRLLRWILKLAQVADKAPSGALVYTGARDRDAVEASRRALAALVALVKGDPAQGVRNGQPVGQVHAINEETFTAMQKALETIYVEGLRSGEQLEQYGILQRGLERVERTEPWKALQRSGQAGLLREAVRVKAVEAPRLEGLGPRLYIPVLRTAHTLSRDKDNAENTDIFEQATRVNYAIDEATQPGITVWTGLKLYDKLLSDRGAAPEIRDRIDHFQEFVADRFLNTRKFQLTARTDNAAGPRRRLSVRTNDDERDIHHMGDGINALVVLLYPIFTAEPGSWIFIEEPETFLHPGLQRVLLDVLQTEPALRSHRVFMTTHSNHLMELTLRDSRHMAVFSFERKETDTGPRFSVAPVVGPGHEVLSQLGVTSSSVLLANCTLWVEGITDRRYLRTYLRCLLEHDPKLRRFSEDIHYAFFEFAGSNVEHYVFDELDADETRIRAQFLSSRIFLLHDRDDGRKDRFARFEASAGPLFVFRPTEGREIENEVGTLVMRLALAELPAKRFAEGSKLALVDDEAYRDVPLGTYLKELFDRDGSVFVADSGTLTTEYKRKLAELVETHATWDNIGPRAQALAQAAYDFIAKSNGVATK